MTRRQRTTLVAVGAGADVVLQAIRCVRRTAWASGY